MNEELVFEDFDRQLGPISFSDFLFGRSPLPDPQFETWNRFVAHHTRQQPRISLDLTGFHAPTFQDWFQQAPKQDPLQAYLDKLEEERQKTIEAILADSDSLFHLPKYWGANTKDCAESHFFLTRLAGKGIESGFSSLADEAKDQLDVSLSEEDRNLAGQGIDRFFDTLGKSISCELDSIFNYGLSSRNLSRIHQSLNQEIGIQMQQPHKVAKSFDYGFIHRLDIEEDELLGDLIGGRFGNIYKPLFDLDLKGLSRYIDNAELGVEATFPFSYRNHSSSLDVSTSVVLPFENIENPKFNLNLDYTWQLHGGSLKWGFQGQSNLDGEDYGFHLNLEIIPGKGK